MGPFFTAYRPNLGLTGIEFDVPCSGERLHGFVPLDGLSSRLGEQFPIVNIRQQPCSWLLEFEKLMVSQVEHHHGRTTHGISLKKTCEGGGQVQRKFQL